MPGLVFRAKTEILTLAATAFESDIFHWLNENKSGNKQSEWFIRG